MIAREALAKFARSVYHLARWAAALALGVLLVAAMMSPASRSEPVPSGRREVIFWHFWGGADRRVVDDIVDRFNRSQDEHFVRAVAMPGNNLDLKLFLSVTGGDAPDLVNQDDPIVADWAHRGMLIPLDELAGAGEMVELEEWLFPAARKLGEHDGRLFALCNGLDIRALYYNQTLLAEHGLSAPRTLAELDRIAETIAPPDQTDHARFGYLPDSRRLWAWGVVFGGDFYDEPSGAATLTDPAIGRALEWMGGYRRRYGGKTIANFRQGDQALPGAAFPLLPTGSASPHGRYAVIMDGQWRVRDIAEASRQRLADGLPVAEYGVCPLPPPADGDANAGWVNGNFFLCLRGCRNPAGAWEFMKFWSGFPATSGDAAKTCADGGWIPVSQRVVDEPAFQDFLAARPLFRQFVELAASPNQEPIPIVPGAAFFDRAVRDAGGDAMQSDNQSPRQILERANSRVNEHLTRRTQGGRP